MPWRGPEDKDDFPTLGYQVLEWMGNNLIVPDGPLAGDPLWLTDEQARFVASFYAVDPKFRGPAFDGKRVQTGRMVRRAVLSRAKGWGKSPLLAALAIVESLADVVMDGWDADGEPVARSWASLGFKAKAQIVAVSEDQTANTWDPVLEMCREGPVARNYQIEPMETFVNVPRGRIEFTTSAARSREGFRPVFAVMDQTESWVPSIGGPKLAATIRRNLVKTGGSSVETPNAFVPGENSVAEKSHEAWRQQIDGRLHNDLGIMYDHLEAPANTDLADPKSLRSGLVKAYGDSTWVDLDRVMADIWDPATDPSDARRFFLNQMTSATDAWVSHIEWLSCLDVDRIVDGKEPITLGFDGSRKRNYSVTDATALIGCTVVGKPHLFELGVWEQPTGPAGDDWEIPAIEVDAAVRTAFSRYNVVGFFADPALWQGWTAKWEADFGVKLKVRASRDHPIEWWVSGGRIGMVVRALEQMQQSVVNGELTHDGSSALTRHVLNARRRIGRSGVTISKESPESDRKIDAAIAAMLAVAASRASLAAGVGSKGTPSFVPRRIS